MTFHDETGTVHRISQQRARTVIGSDQIDFELMMPTIGLKNPDRAEDYSLFEFYRLYMANRLFQLGHDPAVINSMPFSEQRARAIGTDDAGGDLSFDFSEIFNSAQAFDMEECRDIIVSMRNMLGLETFLKYYVIGLLEEIGRRWEMRDISVSTEHFLSTTIKHYIGSILLERHRAHFSGFNILVTTPFGEIHELGAMIAAVLAKMAGHNVLFLGAQLPVSQILDVVERRDIQMVCIASSFLEKRRLSAQVRQLKGVLKSGTILCLGGRAIPAAELEDLPETLIYPDMSSFIKDMMLFSRLKYI